MKVNELPFDKIVSMIVKEVLKELEKNNIKVVYTANANESNGPNSGEQSGFRTKKEKIDMSVYKSPVLTENHINRLHELTGEIIIPGKTIVTPKARQALRSKKIAITYES